MRKNAAGSAQRDFVILDGLHKAKNNPVRTRPITGKYGISKKPGKVREDIKENSQK
jgi:hypothetical protein